MFLLSVFSISCHSNLREDLSKDLPPVPADTIKGGGDIIESPVNLLPSNPHYFLFRGKTAVLMTVGEHYSSLVNKDFDFETYHKVLHSKGLNQTRVFSGAYLAPVTNNTPLTAKGKDNYMPPWAWSEIEGGYHGYKLDLDKWNPDYFKRLNKLLSSASEQGIVVELVLFCPFYNDRSYIISPLNPENNIQGVGGLDHFHRFLTLTNPELVEYQKKLVGKIVSECRDFDNVYFEIANEPYCSKNGNPPVTADERAAWHKVMIDTLLETERSLPEEKKHMIAVNDVYSGIDFTHVSIINLHYVANRDNLGAMLWLGSNYGTGKALVFDETEFTGTSRIKQYTANDARVEAWEFMIGGGSGYSNLALTTYTTDDETGNTPNADSLRNQIGTLKGFLEGMDLTKMSRDKSVLAGGLTGSTHTSALSDPGKEYVLYFHHGVPQGNGTAYLTQPGSFQVKPELNLPAGKYKAEWINPADLKVIQSVDLESSGERISLSSPVYVIDAALIINGVDL